MIEGPLSELLKIIIEISVGMLGLFGTFIGLMWGFTQFILRTRAMSDIEFINFLQEASHIIRYLIISCLIFIGVTLFSAAVFISEDLAIQIPYLGSFTVISLFLFLSIASFALGLSFSVYIFYMVGRSIVYLSRRP